MNIILECFLSQNELNADVASNFIFHEFATKFRHRILSICRHRRTAMADWDHGVGLNML